MNSKLENIEEVFQSWKNSSDDNFSSMLNLFKLKEYSWALFIGHLVIEKLLKAIYVKKFGQHAILSHDLLRLAKLSSLDVSEQQAEWLDEITTFNINARYDNYKDNFAKICTKDYANKWVKNIQELREWLITQL